MQIEIKKENYKQLVQCVYLGRVICLSGSFFDAENCPIGVDLTTTQSGIFHLGRNRPIAILAKTLACNGVFAEKQKGFHLSLLPPKQKIKNRRISKWNGTMAKNAHCLRKNKRKSARNILRRD